MKRTEKNGITLQFRIKDLKRKSKFPEHSNTVKAEKSEKNKNTHNSFQVFCHLLEFRTFRVVIYWAVLRLEKLHVSAVNQCG